MSGSKIHAMAYLFFSLLLTYSLLKFRSQWIQPESYLISILFGLIFSLLPDLDCPNSHIRKYFSKTILSLSITSLVVYLTLNDSKILILLAIFALFFYHILWSLKHRGILHNYSSAIIFSIPLLLINPTIGIYGLTGYSSHILLDRLRF